MTKFVKEMFHINLFVMRALGSYPTKNFKRLYKIYSFITYCIFTILIPILACLCFVTDPNITLDKITENAFVTCQLLCIVVKIIPFHINDEGVRNCIYMMEHPIFVTYSKRQQKLVDNCKRVCRQTSWFYMVFVSAVVMGWSIAPFFEESKKLPTDIWLPSIFLEDTKLYSLSFVYVVMGTTHGAISNGAIDPLVATIAYFITTQIKILKDNLLHLDEYGKQHVDNGFVDDKKEELRNALIYEQIKKCIEHHNIIMEFVSNYENTFSVVAVSQFSASVLVICVCCFKLSQVTLSSMSFIWMFGFLMLMLSEIFLYSYFGTTLFEENNTLGLAVYMGQWYEYDLQSQRALITLMERSKRPMIVTSGKILDLSLDTFTTTLKRAYSLLAVLKNY